MVRANHTCNAYYNYLRETCTYEGGTIKHIAVYI